MAFMNKNFSVIAYANGFTLWHYKTNDTIAKVQDPAYFARVAVLMNAGDNVVIPLCKKGCGCGAHNHTGNDKRLLEINKVIYNKLYMMGQARIFNNESKRLYGVDYPTYYRQRTMVEIAKKVSKPLSKVLSDAYLDMANYGNAKITEKDLKCQTNS